MVVVGGVGHLYQGDLDAGRHVIARLAGDELPAGTIAEDFDYGAVAVAQRLEELRPTALVLVGGVERGRRPGTIERREVGGVRLSSRRIRQAVAEAVTGSMTMDLLVEVASGLGAMPTNAVAIEVEPALTSPSETLSTEVAAAIDELASLARREIERAVRRG